MLILHSIVLTCFFFYKTRLIHLIDLVFFLFAAFCFLSQMMRSAASPLFVLFCAFLTTKKPKNNQNKTSKNVINKFFDNHFQICAFYSYYLIYLFSRLSFRSAYSRRTKYITNCKIRFFGWNFLCYLHSNRLSLFCNCARLRIQISNFYEKLINISSTNEG